jgi:hypothetical protein
MLNEHNVECDKAHASYTDLAPHDAVDNYGVKMNDPNRRADQDAIRCLMCGYIDGPDLPVRHTGKMVKNAKGVMVHETDPLDKEWKDLELKYHAAKQHAARAKKLRNVHDNVAQTAVDAHAKAEAAKWAKVKADAEAKVKAEKKVL